MRSQKMRKDLKNSSRLKNEVQNGNVVFNIFCTFYRIPSSEVVRLFGRYGCVLVTIYICVARSIFFPRGSRVQASPASLRCGP